MQDKTFSREQAADYLGISEGTLRNWRKAGLFLADSDGRYSRCAVDRLLQDIQSGKINRLRSRANKQSVGESFSPHELAGSGNRHISWLNRLYAAGIEEESLPIAAVFLYLKTQTKLGWVFNTQQKCFEIPHYTYLSKELSFIGKSVHKLEILNERLMNLDLSGPAPERDWFGFCYQVLHNEGEKNKKGSYFTPFETAYNAIVDSNPEKEGLWLDPCCGAGAFLSAMAAYRGSPERIRGFDIDPLAISFARIQLQCDFSDRDFCPDIHLADFLSSDRKYYRFIATNPPWGVKYSQKEKRSLNFLFKDTGGFESFALFLRKSIEQLEKDGKLFFLLPESFCNTIRFSSLRKWILDVGEISAIEEISHRFKKVYTPGIGFYFRKTQDYCELDGLNSHFFQNPACIFNFAVSGQERELLEKVLSFSHFSLKENCRWGMGIVTGNNRELCFPNHEEGREAVYRGREISPWKLKPSSLWLKFDRSRFQQSAPEEFYRTPKILYRFISDRIIAVPDTQGIFCLNSLNFFIPAEEPLSQNGICGMLNSSIINFLYRKIFFSRKVLRQHLEEMPLFLLIDSARENWEKICLACAEGKEEQSVLDHFLYSQLDLNEEEIELIEKSVYSHRKSAIRSSSSSN